MGATDTRGRILLWNPKAEESFGWTKTEAQAKRFDQLLRAKFEFPVEEIFSRLRRDGHWQGQIQAHHKDGHEIILTRRMESLLR